MELKESQKKLVFDHFDHLGENQKNNLIQFADIICDWNDKINMISRKDIDNIYLHHILHSLSITKKFKFKKGTEVLDLGTGGGFPGIPLAIAYPEVRFHLIDARGKKINVVNEAIELLSLDNVTAEHVRVEDHKIKYDFVVSRAVTNMSQLIQWTHSKIKDNHINIVPNGTIALKGGNKKQIKKELPKGEYFELFSLLDIYNIEYFEDKYIIYHQA